MTPVEGEVWLVNLDPVVANEQAGVRPCLVISTDPYNRWPIRHAMIAPITSRDRKLSHHVPMVDEAGLDLPSYAMPEYARAVSATRFRRKFGRATPETLALVRFHVRQFLGQRPAS